ncbi:MAG: hypothetical protein CSA25_06010 [Desulfobacter postgatei]|uniref:Pentapeptide repeat-containing protein n=1 Tax=Desulfobacter postgatei TaxID=2293 RepID=A0A2G6MQP0_9BACT|nr:MAG: hypothetical protein CSA25_06010 [Desulfobacter postgatei]
MRRKVTLIYNVCTKQTDRVVKIDWGEDKTAFGEWVKRLQGQRKGRLSNFLILECLAFWDLKGLELSFSDFFDSDLFGANLEGANLTKADLRGAKLDGVHLPKEK